MKRVEFFWKTVEFFFFDGKEERRGAERLKRKILSVTFPSSSFLRRSDASPLHSSFRTDSRRPIRIVIVVSSGVATPPPPPAVRRREEMRPRERRPSEGCGLREAGPAPAPLLLPPKSNDVFLFGDRGDEGRAKDKEAAVAAGAAAAAAGASGGAGACCCCCCCCWEEVAIGSGDDEGSFGGGDGVGEEEELCGNGAGACSSRPSVTSMTNISTLSSRCKAERGRARHSR